LGEEQILTHRHCFALDLVDDVDAVRLYEEWHRPGNTPREIIAFFRAEGVEDLQIYRAGNRLFMILDLSDGVSASEFASAGAANGDVQAWTSRMSAFQQPIVFGAAAAPSSGWVEMNGLFDLKEHP
jgi:L-rhamnose mutarotase